MGFFVPHRARGFTLVEVLFVASIIVLVSSVGYANFSEARKESRDVQRASDLGNLQVALRLYKDAHNGYPSYNNGISIGTGSAFDALIGPYLSGVVRDPLGNGQYQYYYDSDYSCAGVPDEQVLIALTMERADSGNHTSVCGATVENLGVSGANVTPTANSYVVILR